MIYTFDKQQNILRALDENNFLTAELTFKINEATTFSFTLTPNHELTDKEKYVALPHPLDQTKFIMLRLISRTDNKDDIEYTAYEYAYQELSTSGYIKDTRPQNANALTLMTKALDGSGWSVGRTTVAGTATTNFYYTDYLSAVSKVVELLGGEIVFYVEITGNKITGRYMDYLFRQGVDTSKVFADGSNLLSVTRKKQSDSIYTAILPRGKGEQVSDGGGNEPDGYGRRIDIKDVVWSTANGKPLNKPAGSFILEDPQATAEYGQTNGNARLLIQNFDEVDDPNVLIQQAYNMLMTMNHPLIEYSATVSDVGTLSLGDTVLIMHGQRNLSYKTRVFQVKYDLLHSENTELSLGDNLSSNNITSQINAIRSSIQTNSNQQAWTVSQFGRPSTTFGATQPTEPKIGDVWFKSLPDGNVEIWYYNGTIWVKVITPTTGEEIAQAVDDAVAQANAHTDEVKQGLSSDIATAKSQAASLANEAQQNAIDVASKSLGTYLVRLLPGTNIFKTTNSTTIQAQVWKAGQDITSTLDSASFYWKIAKDGADAISLTNNVKNVTAKPSDFNNTGTYIVNVIIPVTDTTGTTRNQTFSDSTTIAKVTDGQDGANGQNGATGANGNGISKTTITYQLGTSATTAPAGMWTSTIPPLVKGQYLWTRTVWTYTDGTSETGYTTSYIAKDGNNGNDGIAGKDGVGITNTAITYSSSASGTDNPTTGWTTTVPTVSAGNYLWTRTVWKYSDATTETGYSVARMGLNGADGKDGIAGKNGTDGIGITDTTVTYQLSASGTTTPTGTWTNSVPALTKGQYLWTRTVWTYTDRTTETGYSVAYVAKDGNNGTDGVAGKDGVGITSTIITYAGSTSGTVAPTTGYTSAVPTVTSGNFLWTKTVWNYSDNTTETGYSVAKMGEKGADGKDGIPGKDGNGIASTSITYATSTSGTTAPATGYTSTIPSVAKGSYLWQRTIYTFTNGTTKTSDIVTYFSKDGVNGVAGMDGGQGMIAQPTKPTSGLVDGFLWLDTSQTYPVYYIYDSSIKDFKIYQFNAKNINADQLKAKFVGTDRLSASEIIADDLHVKSANIDGKLTASQITVSSTNGSQTSLANFNLGEMSQTISDTGKNLTEVKITADGINKFVRDANGNISSEFQTAFSKTSIITGSTLASSIQTQTASQISSALTDNNGKIISLINQDSSGVQIAGKNIVLDGNTTVTGDFYAKGGNFKNLNASNLTVGTLNGNQVNITNINANNIVSGSISGANLDINLNTGQVVFQHGRIYNDDINYKGIDINIDQSYISTKDYLGYSTLANGGLYLSQTRLNDPGYKPYFSIDNNNTPFGTLGALLLGTNGVAIATEGNSVPTVLGKEAYNGLLVKKGKQTLVAGASNGVMISGGKDFGNTNPFINVGATDMIAGTGGNRVQVYAKYFHLPLQWSTTTSNAANMFISLDGAIVRSSSSSKYKLDIEYEQQAETANRLLTLDPATWHDKFESKQLDKFHKIGVDPERKIDMSNRRYYGIIAEDLVKAGLEHLVSRNVETGEVEGVEYSKIGVALIPIIRDLRNRLNDQNVEIERLKEKIK